MFASDIRVHQISLFGNEGNSITQMAIKEMTPKNVTFLWCVALCPGLDNGRAKQHTCMKAVRVGIGSFVSSCLPDCINNLLIIQTCTHVLFPALLNLVKCSVKISGPYQDIRLTRPSAVVENDTIISSWRCVVYSRAERVLSL